MRYFLLYFSWLGSWLCSEMARSAYEYHTQGKSLSGLAGILLADQYADKWIEAARFMLFFSVFAFALIARSKKEKSISFQVQLEHVMVILGAKVFDHFCQVLNEFGYITEISPYVFSTINYYMAIAYILATPIRINYLKRKMRYNG